MSLAIPIPLTELCRLAEVSRAGFYRWRGQPPAQDADMELRDAIQPIAVEWPCYGSRRITRELWDRGRRVNRMRVQRLMREDNLLCLRKRRFVMTTDSDHGLPVYPNLARHLVLTGIDQLWVADLTYIRLVAGSRRPDFPNQSERMLLDVIANRAVIDLQQAISVDEHKQLAQRNATLIAENEQLKREIAKRKLADEALQISQNAFSNIIDTIPTTLGRRALTATANS